MPMNWNSKINQKNNSNEARTIAATPMAGAVVTAAILLSGLFLIGSLQQSVLAQQGNMTGGAGAAGNATNATMTGAAGNATSNGNATTSTTAGGPTAGEGEGSGGGAAGGGGTPTGQ